MRCRSWLTLFTLAGSLLLFLPHTQAQAGTVTFYANGEELATEGFTSPELTKDGWTLRFEHIYVTLAAVSAYQTDPPFAPHRDDEITAARQVSLPGPFTLDLTGDAAQRVLIGAVDTAPPGHYNALSWRLVKADSGPAAGYSMMLTGTADKDGRTRPFVLYSAEESTYRCGEYIGDERKGFLSADDGSTDLELTFHLDHIFGRADRSAEDPMNLSAHGFDPFADNKIGATMRLRGLHIGHTGEGHCRVEWH